VTAAELEKVVWQCDQVAEHLALALQGPLTTAQHRHLKYARVVTMAMRVLFDDERQRRLATVTAQPTPMTES
jgi:hypothetical protein